MLSAKLRDEVREMQTSIAMVPMSASDGENETLRKLRRAVIERKTVHLDYNAYYAKNKSKSHTTRKVDPYGLVNYTGLWYLIAYCHLREALRYFRLDRIANLTLTDRIFIRPANFSMEQLEEDDRRTIVISALFDKEVASVVREWRSYYLEDMQDTPEGLLVTLRVHHENEVLNWLFGWGGSVRILEPESLKNQFLKEAGKILTRYQPSE